MDYDDEFVSKGLKCLSPDLQRRIEEQSKESPLPCWPEQTRGVPNICLRSALFGVFQRGHRKAVKAEHIASVNGIEIQYTGWLLDQGDFDVLIHAFHLVSLHNKKAESVQFSVKGFLHGINRSQGKSGREWLKDSFRRLTGSAVEITLEMQDQYGKYYCSYAGSLLEEFFYNSRERSYFLRINPKLSKLFNTGWTQLQWHQRLVLRTDLAKWLHGFYASHQNPFPLKVATLQNLCGSECGRLADFRGKLRSALDELVCAHALSKWRIDEKDKVYVWKETPRTSTASGRGHSGRKGGA